MDSSGILSDDDYDLISNPESSIPDLTQGGRPTFTEVLELPASASACEVFESTRWTASDIQQMVRAALGVGRKNLDHRAVRVYVDGIFDMFNVGHALRLRQAKLSFPHVYLIVGVFTDAMLHQYGFTAIWGEVERAEMVRHCRWVDEVVTDIAWEVKERFVHQRRIDFIAVEEGTSVDPACDKARVHGYDEMRKVGKIIQTKRTTGITLPKISTPGFNPSVLQTLVAPLNSELATPVRSPAPSFVEQRHEIDED